MKLQKFWLKTQIFYEVSVYLQMLYSFLMFQICNELQECHATIDAFLHNTDSATVDGIEALVSKENTIYNKVQELREQHRKQDEDILSSLDEALIITEQSLNAVQMKMYGSFDDHSVLSSPDLKVKVYGLVFP